jgi:5-methylthioadenosine/S-adenosylhomocysteine deaminase
MSSLLIRNGIVVTLNDRLEVLAGGVAARDGRIVAVGGAADDAGPFDRVVDAAGDYVLPGLVQTHVHLCQTLFRGLGDDLPLLEWLRRRIWPLEAAHTAATLRASARLAAAELLAGGTTTVLTMETVHDTDAVFEALADTGLRATVGKCMMDNGGDADVPRRLREETTRSIEESLALARRWHGAGNGRLRVAFAPRFAVSCTRGLLEAVAALSQESGALVHTHAAESRDETDLVRRLTGHSNLNYLARTGLASPRLCVAHCVWVDDQEQALLAERDVKVLHCPGSNLKLGSGVAPVAELMARGVCVSLGADGAACNNRLDMFAEMRLAATLQAMRRGPGALDARRALWMATRSGARTLGLDNELGSLEVGKRADVIVVSRERAHMAPADDPWSALVYGATAADVRMTIVDGEVCSADGRLAWADEREVVAEAREACRQVAARAGI